MATKPPERTNFLLTHDATLAEYIIREVEGRGRRRHSVVATVSVIRSAPRHGDRPVVRGFVRRPERLI